MEFYKTRQLANTRIDVADVQYLFCRWWFSKHQRGPLEGLWRKLTWL